MAIKIEMLRCFSTVAQTGNLADAAIRLGRTQSALSMTLKQLEEHLGQRLFEGERKSQLTPMGEEIFQLARQQLRRFDETVDAIETTAAAPLGLLRIASVPSVACLVFPSAIEELVRLHPGVKVELRDADTERVIDALLRGQVDLGVASGHHALSGIRQEVLFDDTFGLLCAPDHPLALTGDPPTVADVVASGFVNNNLCNLIQSQEVRAELSAANVTVHNTLSLISMVRSGKWVTILPEAVVRIMTDQLAFRGIRELTARRSVTLLARERSRQRHLIDDLRGIVRRFEFDKVITVPGAMPD
ncbi:LysR family transcriptional regulator [Hoeflea poritis]|uniref:LysR family transcriptional regulator n=1 Tax=Hoeflea poritis TaxID=2993659 RepID=A0ABT4VLL0_9HYPH|nr:LysR family transcriptional regulator [Hoeflea poritis]MDA4845597.1 LysR family transcriptional regulator [Hoeflea poritis]